MSFDRSESLERFIELVSRFGSEERRNEADASCSKEMDGKFFPIGSPNYEREGRQCRKRYKNKWCVHQERMGRKVEYTLEHGPKLACNQTLDVRHVFFLPRSSMKKFTAVVSITLVLGLSACGSKKSSSTEASVETTGLAAADTAAPIETSAAATTGGTTYTLKEWSVEGSVTLPAGQTTLNVVNSGQFGHQFIVIKDTTYEDAPKNDLGTVKADALPAGSILGEIAKIDGGATSTLAVNLTPGKYLFLCNIEFGPNSHAGKGQHLNVTVA